MMPNPPTSPRALLPPPEGIFRTFEDLIASVRLVAEDQGYSVVKLRASNYRNGTPTRYDLVCDRGGVRNNSTGGRRNLSTRKTDCPFRAKAVCEVQLGNRWRFVLLESAHNHEARIPPERQNQECMTLVTTIRSFTEALDRLGHAMAEGVTRIEHRLDNIERHMNNLEAHACGCEPGWQVVETQPQGMESPLTDGMRMDEVASRLLASPVL